MLSNFMCKLFLMQLFMFLFLSLTCIEIQAQRETIKVVSPPRGTTLSYTVGLICGELSDENATEVFLVNPKIHKNKNEGVAGQAYRGRFKVLAPLRRGENTLVIRCNGATTKTKLHYQPNENPHKVRVVYMTDSTGNLEFQVPNPGDSLDYRGKLSTAIQGLEDRKLKFFMAPSPQQVVKKQFPKTVRVPYEKVREKLGGNKVYIRIYDSNGFHHAHGDQQIDLGM